MHKIIFRSRGKVITHSEETNTSSNHLLTVSAKTRKICNKRAEVAACGTYEIQNNTPPTHDGRFILKIHAPPTPTTSVCASGLRVSLLLL